MNYFKIYVSLVRRAQNRTPLDGYKEKHHIFPVSVFGANTFLVELTAREHLIAHHLIYKIFLKRYGKSDSRTVKMCHAFRMMATMRVGERKFIISSRLTEFFRISSSERIKGDKNPAKKIENRIKISKAKTGVPRKDMLGVPYMGSTKNHREIIEKSRTTRNAVIAANIAAGKKSFNYPDTHKSVPCSESKKITISIARSKTIFKYMAMTETEFFIWLLDKKNKGTLFRKSGNLDGNITRSLGARNETIEKYIGRLNGKT